MRLDVSTMGGRGWYELADLFRLTCQSESEEGPPLDLARERDVSILRRFAVMFHKSHYLFMFAFCLSFLWSGIMQLPE